MKVPAGAVFHESCFNCPGYEGVDELVLVLLPEAAFRVVNTYALWEARGAANWHEAAGHDVRRWWDLPSIVRSRGVDGDGRAR